MKFNVLKLILIIILTVSISSSCKVKPLTAYKQIPSKAISDSIGYLSDTSSIKLRVNIAKGLELNLNDPVFRYNNLRYSNYKLLSFIADSSETYRIKIYSLCDCLGFRKYIFDPLIRIIGEDGKMISNKLVENYYDYSGIFSINKIWQLGPGLEGKYNIVVHSNNSRLQNPLINQSSQIMINGVPSTMTITVYSTLIGEFYIWVLDSDYRENDSR